MAPSRDPLQADASRAAIGRPFFVVDHVCPGAPQAAAAAQAALTERGVGCAGTHEGDVGTVTADALHAGERYLVVVGDDASFRALVSAVIDAGLRAGEVTVFLIPATGDADLIRTFGLPSAPDRAALHLLGENTYAMDLVRVSTTGPDGSALHTTFAQVSEVAFGAVLARGASRRRGRAARRGRFLAYWRAVLSVRPRAVTVRADRKTWEGSATQIVVGNSAFFHDGLRVSPRSFPGDGVLEVLIWHGPRSDAISLLPKMYRGEHLPDDSITELRAKIGVSIDAVGLPVHADGVLVGSTPARYVIMPGAVRLKL